MITSRTHNDGTDLFGEGFMIYQQGGAKIGEAYLTFDASSTDRHSSFSVIHKIGINFILAPAKEIARSKCFYKCLSFCGGISLVQCPFCGWVSLVQGQFGRGEDMPDPRSLLGWVCLGGVDMSGGVVMSMGLDAHPHPKTWDLKGVGARVYLLI